MCRNRAMQIGRLVAVLMLVISDLGTARPKPRKRREGGTHIAAAQQRFQAAPPKKRRGSHAIRPPIPSPPAPRPPLSDPRVAGAWGGFRPARLPTLGWGRLLAPPPRRSLLLGLG
ncbi:hypothetical protein GQ55_6G001200 [Panicum hallii var. hallii]|uniref:Secreted protein n=1 Tax=Panicum hallii var. hallii TaxID=1504633 RepID=A0A2T7D288_9POAL|nr:hypothetical protein GQ55_6G001200 [Panicum hallii var. hallii]